MCCIASSLTLHAGEVFALAGDNGAGVKHIAGIYRPNADEIRLWASRYPATRRARCGRGDRDGYQTWRWTTSDRSVPTSSRDAEPASDQLFGVLPIIDNRRIRRETEALLARIEADTASAADHGARPSHGQRQPVRSRVPCTDRPRSPSWTSRPRRADVTALAGAQSLNDRDKGFVNELKKYPGLKIAAHRVGNNDPGRALSDAEDILTSHPQLIGLFADNELEGDGAGRGDQEKKLGSKMCAVAFDTSDQEIAFVRDGNLDALIVQNPFMMGYAGVWYALAAANGVVLPHTVDFGRACGHQGEHR